MTDATEALRGQLVLLHSLANDTTEANWRDKRIYILQTCVRMSDALAALDAETPATPADVGEEPVAWGVFRDGKMVAWVPGDGIEFKLPEDTDERRPLYSATALERVVRDRDEANLYRENLVGTWVRKERLESAEAKLAEARKVQKAKDEQYWSAIEQCSDLETTATRLTAENEALRARLETVEAETRERLSNELDPEIGLPSDARLRNIHADLEMRGRKHPDFAVTVHHRNIVLSAVAAELRNLEPRHD